MQSSLWPKRTLIISLAFCRFVFRFDGSIIGAKQIRIVESVKNNKHS